MAALNINHRGIKMKLNQEYITQPEVIKQLKISRSTLWKWRKQGLLKTHKADNLPNKLKRVYFKKADVEELLELYAE